MGGKCSKARGTLQPQLCVRGKNSSREEKICRLSKNLLHFSYLGVAKKKYFFAVIIELDTGFKIR